MNQSFETVTLAELKTLGRVSLQDNFLGIAPTNGIKQALISTEVGSFGQSLLLSSLGLTGNSFGSNTNLTEGSALTLNFTAKAGDTLRFDFNFLSYESPNNSLQNDFAFFSLRDSSGVNNTSILANTSNLTIIPNQALNNTGYQTVEYTLERSGSYSITLGVADVGDTKLDSFLLVDNVAIVPPPATITGTIWNDLNGNGAKSLDELGLQNWTVFLDRNNNGSLDLGEESTVTDGLGNYVFMLNEPGSYTVAVQLTPQQSNRWQSTFPGQNDNILVSTSAYQNNQNSSTISEYNSSGQLINSNTIRSGSSATINEYARDLIVDRDGNIQVYNGTFNPNLTTLSPQLQILSSRSIAGWSTANNLTFGGIAAYENYIYATDMSTGGGQAKGIVRFDLDNSSTLRFADTIDFIDLTVGLDRKLYALDQGSTVHVFDPLTGTAIKNFRIGPQIIGSTGYNSKAIAVNQGGEIYSVDLSGKIYKFSNNGTLLNSINTAFNRLSDIDIAANGKLLISSNDGRVFLSDESLTNPVTITMGTGYTTFATFAQNDLFSSSTLSQTVTLANGERSSAIDFGFQAINPVV